MDGKIDRETEKGGGGRNFSSSSTLLIHECPSLSPQACLEMRQIPKTLKTQTRKIPNPSVTDRVLEYGVEIPDDTLEEGEAR